MTTQAHIFYAGIVQGVGFRYTVRRYARQIGLCGWVRNLRDGRVEILVEGEKGMIEQLMDSVESFFKDHIKDVQLTYHHPQNQFSQFEIT